MNSPCDLMLDVETLTRDRFAKQQDRTAEQQGYGSTDAGIHIVSRYIKDTIELIKNGIKCPKEISHLSPEIISLVCLQVCLSSVANEDSLSQTIWRLGEASEREVYAQKLRDKADGSEDLKKEIDRIARSIMRRHGGIKQRKAAYRAAAQKAGLGAAPWPRKMVATAGVWLLDRCLETPVFVRVSRETSGDYIALTEEAHEHAKSIVEYLLTQRPSMLPVLQAPAPWTDVQANISGYKHYLVRGSHRCKDTLARLRKAIASGACQQVLDAVNEAQDVAYRINRPILEMIRWSYSHSLPIDGFPRAMPIDTKVPEKPFEAMSAEELRVWKKRAADTARANRSNDCESIQLTQDLTIADYIGTSPFWTPLNLDHRGRTYAVCHFNFQRQDRIRALFLFDEGKPLDTEGFYWLKVHLANCGDFDKLSKKSFADRVAWVDANMDRILDVAFDPKGNLWWTEADQPFLFLAACMAMMTPNDCHLPVSFDGACSGLQHLAAMTRDEETARLVNLSATDRPGDVYQTVADKVLAVVTRDAERGHEIASKTLAFGVNRGLVKRNVMTYSYSSGRFGMANQHMEDTMSPLALKVLAGELKDHPFEIADDTLRLDNGVVISRPGYHASRYLATTVYTAIEDTISRPAEAMRFLQSLARALAGEGLPVVWHTPLGLPVVLRYPVEETKRISLWLHDRGVKLRVWPYQKEEKPGIDKTKAAAAIAPSFVHSMDACHLQQTVLQANKAGIRSLALVHDSFGCLPTDAGRLRGIIKGAFLWLYERDVLADIRREALEQTETNMDRIRDLPEYGTYQPTEILGAEYAFA